MEVILQGSAFEILEQVTTAFGFDKVKQQAFLEGYRTGLAEAHAQALVRHGIPAAAPATMPAGPNESWIVAVHSEESTATESGPQKRGRGRPPKSKSPTPAEPETSEPQPARLEEAPQVVPSVSEAFSGVGEEAPEEVEEVKLEPETPFVPPKDAMDALRQVKDKISLDKAREVLAKFECTRIGDLPERKHAAFIKVCQEALAGK